MDRKQIITKLVAKGYSYGEIANSLKISRQRVHQIYYSIVVGKRYLSSLPRTKRKNQLDDFIRYEVAKRDSFTCQTCGYKGKWRDKKIHIHHIDGSGQNSNPNNDPSNLVTLCYDCHANTHKQQIAIGT